MKTLLPLLISAPNDGGTPPPAGGTPSPAAGGTPAPAAGGTPPPAAPPPAAPSSWTEGLSPETKALVELKKFENPDAALKSYINLEKLTGVPAERLLKLPENLSKAEDLMPIFDRLGRPKDAKGYEFKAPEGKQLDVKLTEFAGSLFHSLGLTKTQGEAIQVAYDKLAAEREAEFHQAGAAKVEQETTALKTKWGAAFDQNVKMIREAAPSLGLKTEDIDKLQEVKGFGWTMEFLHGLAKKVGEDSFQGADNGAQGHQILTPAAAQAKINELLKDSEFGKKLKAGDADSNKLWSQLHIWAAGTAS